MPKKPATAKQSPAKSRTAPAESAAPAKTWRSKTADKHKDAPPRLSPEQEAAAALGKGPKPAATKRPPLKQKSTDQWKVIDTRGMSGAQIEKAIYETDGVATPNPKITKSRNTNSSTTRKVPEKTSGHHETVKSGEKQRRPAADKPSQATGERKPRTGKGMMSGPPNKYTPELADLICAALAEGYSLRKICADDKMPSKATVLRWLHESDDFKTKYARAREMQADCFFDDLLEIADDGRNDTYATENGERTDYDVIARSKLRVETRKFMAAKLAPKKYGDAISLNHGVQPDNPLAMLLAQVSGTALGVVKKPDDE